MYVDTLTNYRVYRSLVLRLPRLAVAVRYLRADWLYSESLTKSTKKPSSKPIDLGLVFQVH
jgi:hypothetical protein